MDQPNYKPFLERAGPPENTIARTVSYGGGS
jgi:hypothetical protein